MPVVKYADMPVAKMSATVDRREAHTENLMLTIIDLRERGAQVPVHAHPHEQISYIAEGRVRFTVGEGEGRTVTDVGPGDVVVAPPNTPHGAELLSDSARVIDAFHPIREDFL
jgi:quercetin dioxygenase-like cupin family protein